MENKVAIITGGAGGIGSSVCSNFVDEGTKVVIADVDYDRSKALADELGDYAIGVEVDVKNESSVESIVECAVKTFGRVDYAVHSSGNNIKSPILDLEIDNW